MLTADTSVPLTPCSPKHRMHCSRFHANLVESYRLERHNQEIAFEAQLSHAGERELMRQNGVRLITFKDWLRGIKGCNTLAGAA